jgi:hypothetical protein
MQSLVKPNTQDYHSSIQSNHSGMQSHHSGMHEWSYYLYHVENDPSLLYAIIIKHTDHGASRARPFNNPVLYIGKRGDMKQYSECINSSFDWADKYIFQDGSIFTTASQFYQADGSFVMADNTKIVLKHLNNEKLQVPYPDETLWLKNLNRQLADLELERKRSQTNDSLTFSQKSFRVKILNDKINELQKTLECKFTL